MGKKKILVVDNNTVILKLMTTFLADEGHDVKGVQDAFDALDVLREFTPEIIYLDLVMPKIAGDRLCKIFRTLPLLANCYVAIISAAAVEQDVDFLEIGADAYIAKGPFSMMRQHILETIAESEAPRHTQPGCKKIRGIEHLNSRQITKELLTQNNHLQIILDSMSQGILALADNRVFYANPAALFLLQTTQEHLLGAYLDTILDGSTWGNLAPLIEAVREDLPLNAEHGCIKIHDRHIIPQCLSMKGDSGSQIILLTDITEFKKTKNELLQAEKLWQMTFDTMVDPVALLHADGTLKQCNQAFADLSGNDAVSLQGSACYQFVHRTETFCKDCPFVRARKSGAREELVLPLGEKTYHVIVDALKPAHGPTNGYIHIMRDITEYKKAEEALRESEQRYQSIINASPDNITITDIEGKILMISPAGLTMFGYGSDTEVLGESVADHLALEDRDRALSNLALKAHGLLSGQDEYRGLRKDGSTFDIEVKSDFIRDDEGKPVRVVVIVRDITGRKKAEEERKNMQSQLQQAQKMEAIGTLAGGIAHDFNNILGAILGYAEIAQEDCRSGSVNPSDLDQVIQAGNRARELVKQILAFSRQAESQKIPLQPTVIVKESIKLLRSLLPTTIEIRQDIDPEADLVLADPTQIHQIIMNLCTNSFHAMEDTGGTLSISLRNKVLTPQDLSSVPHVQPGRFVQLSVTDSGPGITQDILEKVFDPYFTTKEAGKGTGMGLAIVHGIVKSFGGFAVCRSDIGRGTVFEISLPSLLKKIEPEAKSVELIPVGTERILFIDDEEMLAKMGRTMLERLGYSVTVRMSSIEALTTFKNQPDAFDLVITDQTMPGMTGIDLARSLMQIRPGIPIILCSGYSNLISEEKARLIGIRGFALKPLAKNQIALHIRRVLDEEGETW